MAWRVVATDSFRQSHAMGVRRRPGRHAALRRRRVSASHPPPATLFEVAYRIGLGAAGNVAADAINTVDPAWTAYVTAPATRSSSPTAPTRRPHSTFSAWRRRRSALSSIAPSGPRTISAAAETLPWVLKAGTAFRWTGSWLTVFTTADPHGSEAVTAARPDSTLVELLNRRRLAGYESYAPQPDLIADRSAHHGLRRDRLAQQRRRGRSAEPPWQRDASGRQHRLLLRRSVHLRHAAVPQPAGGRDPGRAGRQRRARRRSTGVAARPRRSSSCPRRAAASARARSCGSDNNPDYPERGTIRVIRGGRTMSGTTS